MLIETIKSLITPRQQRLVKAGSPDILRLVYAEDIYDRQLCIRAFHFMKDQLRLPDRMITPYHVRHLASLWQMDAVQKEIPCFFYSPRHNAERAMEKQKQLLKKHTLK